MSYKVNEFITLKLVGEKTIIYIKNKAFHNCEDYLLNIQDYKDIQSVDELVEISRFDKSNELDIDYEKVFHYHCRNFQIWAENDYDTRLLYRTIGFPLLKELVRVGDTIAKKVFKKEIAKRMKSGFTPVIEYLITSQKENIFLKIEKKKELKNIKKLLEVELKFISLRIFIMENISRMDLEFVIIVSKRKIVQIPVL